MGKIASSLPTGKLRRFRCVGVWLVLLAAVLVLLRMGPGRNTYIITDGCRTFTFTTHTDDPAAVLAEAGLKLDEGDTFTAEAGKSITVHRCLRVTIDHYGHLIETTSPGETVGQLLNRLGLTPGPQDRLSASPEGAVFDGMVLHIRQVLRQEQTYTGIIHHEVRYCYDSSLPAGTEAVLVEGVDGQTVCHATVTYINGEEVSRELTRETVTRQPVTEVIALGTAPAEEIDPVGMPLIGEGILVLPTGEVLTYTGTMQVLATAYHKSDDGCDDWTATMTRARVGAIAVDPRVIPYCTRMFIVSNDGVYVYGLATAEDCGGAIKGARIDLYYDTVAECNAFGRRDCTIYFLG